MEQSFGGGRCECKEVILASCRQPKLLHLEGLDVIPLLTLALALSEASAHAAELEAFPREQVEQTALAAKLFDLTGGDEVSKAASKAARGGKPTSTVAPLITSGLGLGWALGPWMGQAES